MPRKKKDEMPPEEIVSDIVAEETGDGTGTETASGGNAGECESKPAGNGETENFAGDMPEYEVSEARAERDGSEDSEDAANIIPAAGQTVYDAGTYAESIAEHEYEYGGDTPGDADTKDSGADAAPVEADIPQPARNEASAQDTDTVNTDSLLSAKTTLPGPKTNKPAKPAPARRTITGLDLKTLDKDLSEDQMAEWNALYASYRSKSLLTGRAVGADETAFDVKNRETGETERRKLVSLIVIEYRVKVLIPESEMWMPGEERPSHVIRNMTGSTVDYVIMEIDREGECAIGSRRVALAAKRHFFAKGGEHRDGELLKCRVMAVGAKQCTVECCGFDLRLTQRDLSYTAIADLREKYRPGQELSCLLKSYDRKEGKLAVSVKEVNPNPFFGADIRHPIGSRRQAVIGGKYGGGVFCTLPDDTVCLCLYSAGHSDADFRNGDSVIVVIRQYDYARQLIYGRILSKW